MNSRNRKKEITLIVIGILSVLLLSLILWLTFMIVTLYTEVTELNREMDELVEQISTVDYMGDDTEYFYNDIIQTKVDYLSRVQGDDSRKPLSRDTMIKIDRDDLRVYNIYIVDKSGTVLDESGTPTVDFSSNRFNQLRACMYDRDKYAPVDVSFSTTHEVRFFASKIDSNTMAVIEVSKDQIKALTSEFSTWKNTINNVYVGYDGLAMAVNDIDYKIDYCTKEEYNSQNALALGIAPGLLVDGYSGGIEMNREKYYGIVRIIDDTFVILMFNLKSLSKFNFTIVLVIALVFSIMVFLVVAYATVLRTSDETEHRIYEFRYILKKKYFDFSLSKKLGAIILIGILTVFAVTMYNQTLLRLARCSINNKNRVEEIGASVDGKINNAGSESYFYDVAMEDKCKMVYDLIADKVSTITKEELIEIAELIRVDSILLFDKNGKVYMSNDDSIGYSLSEDEYDQSYAFRPLLHTNQLLVQEPMFDDSQNYMQYAAKTLYDDEKGIVGLLQIGKTAFERERIMAGNDMSAILSSAIYDENSITFSVDKATGCFSYYQDWTVIGTPATEAGIPEKALADGFCGYLTVDGVKCFANCCEVSENYVFIATPISYNTEIVNKISIFSTIVSAAVFFIIYLIICFGNKDDLKVDFKQNKSNFSDMQSAADRWRNSDIRWSEQTPEQKLFTMISDVISVVAFGVTIYIAIVSGSPKSDSIIAYILGGKWEKGINFFAFTASLMAIAVGCVCNVIVKKLFTLLADALTARGTTIFRMLRSATKYVVVILVAFYILRLYGANPKTLITSAGVLTAIIGLGANSLTSDILAGFFLVFEGEFRVGDIVTIDGWRGVVLDIGIRTTKIEDDLHNIKIIENSKVSGLINMTKKTSLAEIYVGIDYGESLERVEEVFAREFPFVKEKIPTVKGGPYYTSVMDLGDNSVVLRILAECNEKDRPQLERDLKREIKLMFDRNNINIPYPQITINQPRDYSE